METFRVERYGSTRFFAVRDAADVLVCLCVYRRGAQEVARRLQALDAAQRWVDANGPAHEVAAPAVWVDPHRRELKHLKHCNEINIVLLWYGGVVNMHLDTGETYVDPPSSY